MRKPLPEKLEAGRLGGQSVLGRLCPFRLMGLCGIHLHLIASGYDDDDDVAQGWEHVSVSTPHRPPNWQEMCWVKDLFWTDEECVVQYHLPRSVYVNNHPHCLHLWRHKSAAFPMPPTWFVGITKEPRR